MKIIFAICSYLFGAIPSGYIIFFIREKRDIRDFGSQSIGATNVLRLKGWKYAIPVVLIDILKGFLPVFLALKIFPDKSFALLCGFLAVLGHCFPVYIKFKGGKGIATTLGVYSVLALKPFLLSVALFLIIVAISRYVSLGSILATLCYPLFVFLFKGDTELIFLGLVIFVLIALKHTGNIGRLLKGKERKLGERIG
ncbi:MAG: glycerol-3-phosphate 1-O-acyltransferase PlsY [Candidatus Aminicenantes bacterium]|nr:MAG: glycerol-3-phosphate 1-O-acyltransferase PlsY [Candidatus Aminicenantes bacterium]